VGDAVAFGQRQIEAAVLVQVVGQVDLVAQVPDGGMEECRREPPVPVVDGRASDAAAVRAEREVEIAVAVEIDEVQARHPGLRRAEIAHRLQAAVLGDVRETALPARRRGGQQEDESQCPAHDFKPGAR
jgi:hypothetical protein